MKTANASALYCELPAELAAAFDEWRAAHKLGKTAAVVRAIEKLLGRKQTKAVERRGRPKKVTSSD